MQDLSPQADCALVWGVLPGLRRMVFHSAANRVGESLM